VDGHLDALVRCKERGDGEEWSHSMPRNKRTRLLDADTRKGVGTEALSGYSSWGAKDKFSQHRNSQPKGIDE